MASGGGKQLEMTVSAIQRRWGLKALRRWSEADTKTKIPCVSTSFEKLDEALGIGGIARGRITEIIGRSTSGMTTLALKIGSNAQKNHGDTVVYVDLSHTFDPDYAARCGVSMERLYIARPDTGKEALEIVETIVSSSGAGILVFDSTHYLREHSRTRQGPSTALRRLNSVLVKSPCALIFLTSTPLNNPSSPEDYTVLDSYATVRLLLERERWLERQGEIRGYRTQVTVLKNKLGPAGQRASIPIICDGTVQGDDV